MTVGLCSLGFVYLVLPGLLALWWLSPGRLRPWLLVSYSFMWYISESSWQYGLMMASSLLFDWTLAGVAEGTPHGRDKRIAIFFSGIKGLMLTVGMTLMFPEGEMPLSPAVYSLSGLWYVINAARGYAQWRKNPVRMVACGSFFPALYAGAPVDAAKNADRLDGLHPTWENIGDGGVKFICGLAKQAVLGSLLTQMPREILALKTSLLTSLDVLLLLVSQMLALYYLLTGYWDMTSGIAKMLGLIMPENYDQPFLCKGINDCFGRLNITVNRFIRRNVYLTLGGAKSRGWRLVRNVLLSSMCMGLWYGLRWNMAVWGVVQGVFVLLEQHYLHKAGYAAGGIFHWMYAMGVMLLSFVFFVGETPAQSLRYLQVLFGAGAGTYSDTSLYLLLSNLPLLLFSVFCLCGAPQWAVRWIKEKAPVLYEAGSTVWSLLLLTASTAFLMV